ncbi:pituitary tumor-transforming gene 1 protein-interacting protein-like isoform X2 [Dreissena polymorpha]|uniref:pituitary tumor-transforming gene 1 protein-interacting protein-like isoform X2 n=1 Tax=Dreissena polymorpha TaxID=45954 RepID=UPI002263FDDC|nr:pituitary tumor-transforming gene 1 protein-interacting protein-like isoform X2 [Dreissena polymorpha]
MKQLLYSIALFATICLVYSSSTTKATQAPVTTSQQSTTKAVTSQPPTPSTTLEPGALAMTKWQECQLGNTSCDACVGVGTVQCVWCSSSSKCVLKKNAIPTDECGGLSQARWGVCWLNYEALIIACSVIGGLLILALTVCICCCCCCKRDKSAKYAKDDAKNARKKEDMKAKHDERRAERKAKTDEIRKKYGLVKEENPYTRFDDA